MKALRLAFSVVLATVSLSSIASAQMQTWLQDRRMREGIGIRVGDLELHPGVAAEVGYDSNYFQRAQDTVPLVRFLVTPSLSLSTLGPERRQETKPTVQLHGSASASYNEFIALGQDSAVSTQVSEQRNVGANVALDANILPQSTWGVDLAGSYARVFMPTNSADTRDAFDRNIVVGGADLVWRPGGGMLDWRVGYRATLNLFEKEAFRGYNNVLHEGRMRGRWRFLPRTAVLYDASVGYQDYTQSGAFLNDATPMRVRGGINGLITNRLSLLALVGWGASFFQSRLFPAQDFDSLLAHAELTWFVQAPPEQPSEGAGVGLSSVSIGYVRDFYPGYIGPYYQRDRAYLRGDYFIAGVFGISGEGGFNYVSHPQSYLADGNGLVIPRHPSFHENRVDVSLTAEYRMAPTLAVTAMGRYDANLSENRLQSDFQGLFTDNLAFQRFQVLGGVRWFM